MIIMCYVLQCGESDRLGVIVIGDSAGAHFSIPPKYFNVSMWQCKQFSDKAGVMINDIFYYF